MRSEVTQVRYRSLVDEETAETGRIVVRRVRSGRVEMLLAIREPAPYFLRLSGPKVEIYKPRIRTVQEYDVSGSMDRVENAMLIGFGTSGSYLDERYVILVKGDERIAGQDTVRLDLQPRDPSADLNNQRLEMWISKAFWQPVQLKLYERNPKDFRLYTYEAVETNPRFASGEFKLDLAPGTRRERPQR